MAQTDGTGLAGGAPLEAPDATFVKQRWIPERRVRWAQEADKILMQYGAVVSQQTYERRHHARKRAQGLIRLMVELRLHESWELVEHTEHLSDGSWKWAVEYVGGTPK